MKRILVIAGILLVLLAAMIGGGALEARRELGAPTTGPAPVIQIPIPCPETIASTDAALLKYEIIRSSWWFNALVSVRGDSHKLHCGIFPLSANLGASEVLDILLAPPPDSGSIRVLLPEGLSALEMGTRAHAQDAAVSAATYDALEKAGDFPEPFLSMRPQGSSLEGFLFPDTYELGPRSTADTLIGEQLDAFQKSALPLLTPTHGLSSYQVLILASVVQAETKYSQDQPLAAGVFFNRLAAGDPLDSDVTVEYAVAGTLGTPPTSADFSVSSPYNTYLVTGLPPTPIDNPGTAAIEAVENAPPTSYLYFVADPSGHLHFATTLAEHNAQVAEYCGSLCS